MHARSLPVFSSSVASPRAKSVSRLTQSTHVAVPASGTVSSEHTFACLALLARKLFTIRERNVNFLHDWIQHAFVNIDTFVKTSSALSMTSEQYELRELQRSQSRKQRRVAAIKMQGGDINSVIARQKNQLQKTLLRAATATVGKRVPRGRARPRFTETPKLTPTNTSYIDNIVLILRVFLTEPIKFTLVAGSKELRLYIFGHTKFEKMAVPCEMLTGEELAAVQYLGITADAWIDPAACTQTSNSEILLASRSANDTFELSFDRIALVGAVVEVILFHVGLVGRQIMEASVMALAGLPEIIESGYHVSLMQIVYYIRHAPRVFRPLSDTDYVAAKIQQHRVRLMDGIKYNSYVYKTAQIMPTIV